MLGEALRLIRVFHDKKLVRLAQDLDISVGYLSEIERGKKRPSIELVEKYANAFGTKPSVILFFSEELDKEKGRSSFELTARDKLIKFLQIIERKFDVNVPSSS